MYIIHLMYFLQIYFSTRDFYQVFIPAECSLTMCTSTFLANHKNPTNIIPFGFKHIKHQGDAILNGCHQLPDTVLVGWVFFGPAGGDDGAIQHGDESTTGSCWWGKNTDLSGKSKKNKKQNKTPNSQKQQKKTKTKFETECYFKNNLNN